MKKTYADQNSPKKQYNFRSSSQLFQKVSALYRELGMPLTTALSIYFSGTASAGTLPFSPTKNCTRFLEARAHRDLLNMVQAELNAPGGPEQYHFPHRSSEAQEMKEFFLDIPDQVCPGNYLWEKRDKQFSVNLDPGQVDAAKSVFQRMGLSVSDAVTLFLQQSIDAQGMPFQPSQKLAEYIRNSSLKLLRKELEAGLSSQIIEDIYDVRTQLCKEDTERILKPFHRSGEEEKCILRLVQAFETDNGSVSERWRQSCHGQKEILPGKDIRLFHLGFEIYEFVQYDPERKHPFVRVRLVDGRKPFMAICVPWMKQQEENTRLITAYGEEKKEQERREKYFTF